MENMFLTDKHFTLMAEDNDLESQLATTEICETFVVVWYVQHQKLATFCRIKAVCLCFLPLFSKFTCLQYERSGGYHAGTSAPL